MFRSLNVKVSATVVTWLAGIVLLQTAQKKGGPRVGTKEKQRILDVLSVVKKDEKACTLIQQVLESAVEYMAAAFHTETRGAMERARGTEGAEYRAVMESLDRAQRRKHDVLIDNLRIANRYLMKTVGKDEIPAGGLYTENPWHLSEMELDRRAIGDWAGRLILGFYEERG